MLAKFEGLKSPTFDDYIEDLAVMFERYPTKSGLELRDVQNAMRLINDLGRVAERLPELPREKGKH